MRQARHFTRGRMTKRSRFGRRGSARSRSSASHILGGRYGESTAPRSCVGCSIDKWMQVPHDSKKRCCKRVESANYVALLRCSDICRRVCLWQSHPVVISKTSSPRECRLLAPSEFEDRCKVRRCCKA